MATLIVYANGVAPVFVNASAGGDQFANDGKTELLVMNSSGSPVVVTPTAVGECSHNIVHGSPITVAAMTFERIRPFKNSQYGNPVTINYSLVTGVTVAAQRLT